ncbi:hypothetical protein [Xanthomonas cerealis]|uniref:hypothetical protein n=1 Tax=Xanthomonas cerealis TaxID=3390025 RepID=UPI000579996F|nr:hypothetical protein [Xanthomonas translucens]UKE46238.1 hypothetical protein KHA79_14040 [Xanthomonas translucens pv. cerealis]
MFDTAPFLDAIALAEAPLRRFSQPWNRQALLAEFGSCCAFCSRPLDGSTGRAWQAVALVPPQLGGPAQVSENWVPSCRRCASAKGLRDVVGWSDWKASTGPDQVAALLDRRRAALLYAENHFTPLSRHAKRERLLACLASRFDKPRFRVHAWSGMFDGERICLVGWSRRAGDGLALSEALLAMRLRDGGEVLAEGHTYLLRLPVEAFLDAVWALIDAHGIVVPLNVTGDGPVDGRDWRECWRYRVHDPVSNHQRLPMTGGPPLPHAPRALSTKPDSVRRLTQIQAAKRADRLTEAELLYREAMARKSKYLDRVKRGLEAPMPLDDYRAWSDEARQLGVDWARMVNESRGQ